MKLDIFDRRIEPTRIVLSLVMLLATVAGASAAPIMYVHTGFGSGTLDGVAFGASAPLAFTITAFGDTDNVEFCGVFDRGRCLRNNNIMASIAISPLGTFDFISRTFYSTFDRDSAPFFNGPQGETLFGGPALPPWDMRSSIGPIAGTGDLLQWSLTPVLTTGGVLFFNDSVSSATFTATVVPEPAMLLLLVSGLGAAAGILRRRSKKRA